MRMCYTWREDGSFLIAVSSISKQPITRTLAQRLGANIDRDIKRLCEEINCTKLGCQRIRGQALILGVTSGCVSSHAGIHGGLQQDAKLNFNRVLRVR